MSGFIRMTKRKDGRLLCTAFLIAMGIIFCLYPLRMNHVQENIQPTPSQSGSIEIFGLVNDQIDCNQGQEIWANWSVTMGKDLFFEIRENSSETDFLLNFGIIPSDIFIIRVVVNTSQPGSFDVNLIIWNSSIRTTNVIVVTVRPNLEITFRYVFLGVMGSVAIATNFAAVFYWQKQRPARKGRILNQELEFPVELSPSALTDYEADDQIYLSTTVLVQMAFIQENTQKFVSVDNFKEVEDPDALQETLKRWISTQMNQKQDRINHSLSLAGHSFLINYLRFEWDSLAVVIVSSKSLHQTFISTLRMTVEKNLPKTDSLTIDFTELQLKLNLVMHLDRSRDFGIPLQTKLDILQKAPPWKSPLEEKESITPVEMGQVQQDLEEMTLQEIEDMAHFLEKGKKILKDSKDDHLNVEGSREEI